MRMRICRGKPTLWGWLKRLLGGRSTRRKVLGLSQDLIVERCSDGDRAAVLGRPDIFVKDLAARRGRPDVRVRDLMDLASEVEAR